MWVDWFEPSVLQLEPCLNLLLACFVSRLCVMGATSTLACLCILPLHFGEVLRWGWFTTGWCRMFYNLLLPCGPHCCELGL